MRIQGDAFPPLFSSAAETKICQPKCLYNPFKSSNKRNINGRLLLVYYFCIRCISIQIFGRPSEDILRDCFNEGFKKECIQGQPLYQSRVLLLYSE